MRYVVKLEIFPSMDDFDDLDDDHDHLQEIQDILERTDDVADECIGDDVYKQMRFDLCSDCRKRFLRNPFGRDLLEQFDFSKN